MDVEDNSITSSNTGNIDVLESLKMIRNELFDADSREVVKYMMKIISNIINNPSEKKYKTLRMSNETFNKRVGRYKSAILFLQASGFKKVLKPSVLIGSNKTEESLEFSSSVDDQMDLRDSYEKLCKFAIDDLGLSSNDIPVILSIEEIKKRMEDFSKTSSSTLTTSSASASAPAETASFDPFKADVFRVVPQPRSGGNMLSPIEQKVEILKKTQERLIEQAGIPDRKLSIFMPSSTFNPKRFDMNDFNSGSNDGSNSLSNVNERNNDNSISSIGSNDNTNNDMSLLKESAIQRRKKMENSEVFRTKAMRELEELKRTKVFTHIIIRIQLPDRCIIQALFSSQEKGMGLYDLVKSCLAFQSDSDSDSFYLYSSPPYQIIDQDKTLQNLGLYPSALIYLGWKNEPVKPWIKEELLTKENVNSEIPEVKSHDLAQAAFGETSKSGSEATSASSTNKAKKAVPKWLKF